MNCICVHGKTIKATLKKKILNSIVKIFVVKKTKTATQIKY